MASAVVAAVVSAAVVAAVVVAAAVVAAVVVVDFLGSMAASSVLNRFPLGPRCSDADGPHRIILCSIN